MSIRRKEKMTFCRALLGLGTLYLLRFSYCDGFALRLFRTTDMSQGNMAKGAGGAGAMPRVTISDSQLFSGPRDIPIFAPAIVFVTTTTAAPTSRHVKGSFRPAHFPAGILSSSNKPCSSYEDCRRMLMRTLMLRLLLKDKDPLAAFRNVGKALGTTAVGSSIRGGSFRMLPFANSTKVFASPKFKTLNLPVIGGKMDMAKVFREKTPILLHPRSIFTPWPEAKYNGRESDATH